MIACRYESDDDLLLVTVLDKVWRKQEKIWLQNLFLDLNLRLPCRWCLWVRVKCWRSQACLELLAASHLILGLVASHLLLGLAVLHLLWISRSPWTRIRWGQINLGLFSYSSALSRWSLSWGHHSWGNKHIVPCQKLHNTQLRAKWEEKTVGGSIIDDRLCNSSKFCATQCVN